MIIRPYQQSDLMAITELHKASFQRYCNKAGYQRLTDDIREAIKIGTVMVAYEETIFQGFCCTTSISRSPSNRAYVADRIFESRTDTKPTKAKIKKLLPKSRPTVVQYRHDFGMIVPSDVYINSIAVKQKKTGIGSKLLSAAMTRHIGSRCFASCISGSGSLELFLKHGFQQIISLSPAYHSGQTMTFVGKTNI
jgi:hypothetical protein